MEQKRASENSTDRFARAARARLPPEPVPGETLRTGRSASINCSKSQPRINCSLFTAATPDTASNRAFEATAGIDSANEEFEFPVKPLRGIHVHFRCPQTDARTQLLLVGA